jgi:hypothetical protein
VPILGFVLGGGFVTVVLRRIVARKAANEVVSGHAEASPHGTADVDLEKLVDAELDDLSARG